MREDRTTSGRWATLSIALLLVLSGPLGTTLAEHEGETEEIWRVSHFVNATVVDNYATVQVGVEIANEGPDPEFPFRVDVPEDAYVTGLTLTRDGETYEAEVKEKQQAREQYEEAKNETRSAGLVSQQSSDDVYAFDVNVEGTETVTAVLTYDVYLTAEGGVYELPLQAPATYRGVDEGATLNAWIDHAGGLESVKATPHGDVEHTDERVLVSYSEGPRGHGEATEMQVRYEVAETEAGGSLATTVEDGTGYFAHRFRAGDTGESVPLDIALVLDRSGSMRGDKIDQMQSATRGLVDALDEDDRLHVTFFSDRTNSPWKGFRPVNASVTDEAFEAIADLRATGSTNIELAIEDGFGVFEEADGDADRLPVVVFLTDGMPTRGLQDPDALRSKAMEANVAEANVFSLAFGSEADWGLVHGLAEDGDGLAQRIEADGQAEVDLSSFLQALTSPVLTDVSIHYDDAEAIETWRVGAPVLFASGELVYVGTFDSSLESLEATVTAQGPNETHAWDVSEAVDDEGPDYLADLVAYQRIRALEDRIAAEGGNETLEAQATELAIEHGFVTEHTSLFVDLPEQPSDDDGEFHDDADETAAVDESASRSIADGSDDGQPARDGSHDEGSGDVEETSQPAETPTVGIVAGVAVMAAVAIGARRKK